MGLGRKPYCISARFPNPPASREKKHLQPWPSGLRVSRPSFMLVTCLKHALKPTFWEHLSVLERLLSVISSKTTLLFTLSQQMMQRQQQIHLMAQIWMVHQLLCSSLAAELGKNLEWEM